MSYSPYFQQNLLDMGFWFRVSPYFLHNLLDMGLGFSPSFLHALMDMGSSLRTMLGFRGVGLNISYVI